MILINNEPNKEQFLLGCRRYTFNNTIKKLDIDITHAYNVMSMATNSMKVVAIHVMHGKEDCKIAYMVNGSRIQVPQ
jgi:hypothetical protein